MGTMSYFNGQMRQTDQRTVSGAGVLGTNTPNSVTLVTNPPKYVTPGDGANQTVKVLSQVLIAR